jgi:uncharacterized membrane protein
MDFIQTYFIEPITNPGIQGYNMINTIVFSILLIIACIIIFKLLKNKINFNSEFFIALIPYIIFGASMRVIMHQIESGRLIIYGIMKTANPLELGFWFFTPGIWLLTFSLVLIGLLIAGVLKSFDSKKLLYFGIIFALPVLFFNFLSYNNWFWFILTFIIIVLVTFGIVFLINKFTKYKIFNDRTNFFIVLGQAIDSIGSSIAITFFPFTEQHVVSDILIKIHPLVFIIVKLLIAVLLCWSIDDYIKESNNKQLFYFIKVVIAILGLATGLGSLLKLGII